MIYWLCINLRPDQGPSWSRRPMKPIKLQKAHEAHQTPEGHPLLFVMAPTQPLLPPPELRKQPQTLMPKRGHSDSDEDDTFFYRYPSAAPPPPSQSQPTTFSSGNPRKAPKTGGSGGLAPSKSTLYLSNLDYTLTNSDLHVLLSHFGPIARVTVLKDPRTRASRGVAFVQFVSASDARNAASDLEGKVLNGRKIKASIAKDNGRAAEFIRKRVYKDKSRCYECGAEGHLSYECPKNVLGPRERPVPKKGRRALGVGGGRGAGHYGDGREEEVLFEEESWAAAVDDGAEERLLRAAAEEEEEGGSREKKEKRASYFSDESGEDE